MLPNQWTKLRIRTNWYFLSWSRFLQSVFCAGAVGHEDQRAKRGKSPFKSHFPWFNTICWEMAVPRYDGRQRQVISKPYKSGIYNGKTLFVVILWISCFVKLFVWYRIHKDSKSLHFVRLVPRAQWENIGPILKMFDGLKSWRFGSIHLATMIFHCSTDFNCLVLRAQWNDS